MRKLYNRRNDPAVKNCTGYDPAPSDYLDDDSIYITETAMNKLRDAYADVRAEDDEYAVPAYTIAESSIFVDCKPLGEEHQTRSRFNVVAHGDGVKNQLITMQQKYNGKVREDTTHIHQFGYHPCLSGTDVGGYRMKLSNPKASKPYADGNRIPAILVTDSGHRRKFLGFYVTPTEVRKAKLIILPDNHPAIVKAWKLAPIAMPETSRSDLIEQIEEDLGDGWSAKLARSKKNESMVLLLRHIKGKDFVLELGAEFPRGSLRLFKKGCKNQIFLLKHFNPPAMLKDILSSDLVESTFSMNFYSNELPQFITGDGLNIDKKFVFLDYLNWKSLGNSLLSVESTSSDIGRDVSHECSDPPRLEPREEKASSQSADASIHNSDQSLEVYA